MRADSLELGSKEPMAKERTGLEGDRGETRAAQCDQLEGEDAGQRISLSGGTIEKGGEQKARGLQIPPDFRCPLSLELMSDPVIVASGQTYERAYIQQWLEQGNTTCPKTRQTLTHTNLIPNYTVKALIANWCEANNISLPETAKIDTLNAILRPPTPPINGNAESEERRVESPPRFAHLELVVSQQQSRERGMSGIGSRPPAMSRRTPQSRSSDDREIETTYFQNGADEHGETSQPVVPRGLAIRHLDGEASLRRTSVSKEKYDASDSGNESPHLNNHHHRTGSSSSVASSVDDGQVSSKGQEGLSPDDIGRTSVDSSPYQSDVSGEIERPCSASAITSCPEESGSLSRPRDRMGAASWRRRGEEREMSLPRIVPSPMQETLGADGNAEPMVEVLVRDLQSDDLDVQRQAAAELRLLAKYNMENRILIANSGAIKPLVALLTSTDPKTQENAVTALLNLSINDNNKTEIAAAGAIDPLVTVLKVGNAQAMENAAATLFSLSVMDENKVTIGNSGAIPPLVHLLINGTPRGKKDAATALFNLSIFHENKARIVRAGAIKPLVELMADPASGMVDKAVAVVANLATIPEGRFAIGEESGIPALVEVVEAGSQRGKENAAAALLQLCMISHRHRALVLQEGAIPPLVALSQSGTARAKEKASALLRHFREQRHQLPGPRHSPHRHIMGQY